MDLGRACVGDCPGADKRGSSCTRAGITTQFGGFVRQADGLEPATDAILRAEKGLRPGTQ